MMCSEWVRNGCPDLLISRVLMTLRCFSHQLKVFCVKWGPVFLGESQSPKRIWDEVCSLGWFRCPSVPTVSQRFRDYTKELLKEGLALVAHYVEADSEVIVVIVF